MLSYLYDVVRRTERPNLTPSTPSVYSVALLYFILRRNTPESLQSHHRVVLIISYNIRITSVKTKLLQWVC